MKILITLLMLTIAAPTLGAIITFDFNRLTLTSDTSEAFFSGAISFDDTTSDFSAYSWESFAFTLDYNGDTFLLEEDHLSDIEIVDLEDLIFGNNTNPNDEGFIFSFFDGNYTLATGYGGMGEEDSCFYTDTEVLCAQGLFTLARSSSEENAISASSPSLHMFIPLLLMVLVGRSRNL